MKRILTMILALVLCAGFLTLPVLAAEDGPTKAEIQQKWQAVHFASTTYSQTPSVSAPYAAGALTEDFLQSGVTYLNYVRFVAGLPEVTDDDTYNLDAQHGAVVLAAIDTLTHYPDRPADMSDTFFNRGYSATTSSNISARWGFSDATTMLQSAISGCMSDSSSQSNLSCLGHRRWLLNPRLGKVGFGYAVNPDSGWHYIVTKVFDRSGPNVDYDFVSWPAAGNHPTNLFATTDPWSITLNPGKYQTPAASDLTITITRRSDGKQWSFNSGTGTPTTSENPYMLVDRNGYGVSNCIIFHPGSKNVDKWEGVFDVSVKGLTTSDGKSTELKYSVDFFDVTNLPCEHSYKSVVTEATCTEGGYTTHTCRYCGSSYTDSHTKALGHGWSGWQTVQAPTCTEGGLERRTCSGCGKSESRSLNALGHAWQGYECTRCGVTRLTLFDDVVPGSFYEAPVAWAVENGITSGTDDTHFSPGAACNRAQVVTFLWAAAGKPEPESTVNPFTDVPAGAWFEPAVLWAVEEGITSGTDTTHFSPAAPCNRATVVTFLWSAAGKPAASAENPFTDVPAGAWFEPAVRWALENGVTSGVSENAFGASSACNRAQVVTFLYAAFGK